MVKRTKKSGSSKIDTEIGNVLSLRTANGALERTFDADVIQSMRYMATDLTLNSELPPRVAIISALRGEGVTFTAVTLGLTLASDTGARVCVVELNWWTPGMITLLDPKLIIVDDSSKDNAKEDNKKNNKKTSKKQIEPPRVSTVIGDYPGLAKVLAGEVSLDEAIIHTDLPNFDLLPAGAIPIAKRPSTARSSSLRNLLDELSTRYDQLFLDIPAVRTTSDSIALASLANACIVVAQQGATSTSSVQKALDDVKSLTMLGVVLNKVSINMPDWIRSLVPQE
jgi:Mrp family chromosome partitioning ATPase